MRSDEGADINKGGPSIYRLLVTDEYPNLTFFDKLSGTHGVENYSKVPFSNSHFGKPNMNSVPNIPGSYTTSSPTASDAGSDSNTITNESSETDLYIGLAAMDLSACMMDSPGDESVARDLGQRDRRESSNTASRRDVIYESSKSRAKTAHTETEANEEFIRPLHPSCTSHDFHSKGDLIRLRVRMASENLPPYLPPDIEIRDFAQSTCLLEVLFLPTKVKEPMIQRFNVWINDVSNLKRRQFVRRDEHGRQLPGHYVTRLGNGQHCRHWPTTDSEALPSLVSGFNVLWRWLKAHVNLYHKRHGKKRKRRRGAEQPDTKITSEQLFRLNKRFENLPITYIPYLEELYGPREYCETDWEARDTDLTGFDVDLIDGFVPSLT